MPPYPFDFPLKKCFSFEIIKSIEGMEQFKVNDKVMHCREGLSIISSTTFMCDREYFIVRSVNGDGEAIYVPVLTANSIIRKLLSKDAADALLSSISQLKMEFNPNTKQRRDAFKKRLSSGDVKDIAYLFMQGHLYNENADQVRLGPADIEMIRYATKCLLDELALTYEIDRDKIEEFVINKIK